MVMTAKRRGSIFAFAAVSNMDMATSPPGGHVYTENCGLRQEQNGTMKLKGLAIGVWSNS